MGEAFADQPGQFGLVIKRVEARDNAACAMTEQKKGQSRFSRSCLVDNGLDVLDVILKLVNVEALAIRTAAAAQVHGVDGQALCGQLLGYPSVVATMGVKTRNDDDHRARLFLWTQRP